MPMYPIDENPSDEPIVTIALNEQWFSAIMGMFERWQDRRLWEPMSDSEWFVLEQKIINAMGQRGNSATVITDIRVNNGVLQVLRGGMWVSVDGGCIDCGDDYFPSIGGQYSVSGADRWCFAAWVVASASQVLATEFMQNFQLGTTFVAESAESIISFLADIGTGTVAGIALDPLFNLATNATTLPAISYVNQNLADENVLKIAASLIYCGIKAAAQANDLDNVASYIGDSLNNNTAFVENEIGEGEWNITNFGNIIDFVFNTATDLIIADLIVRFWLGHSSVLGYMGLRDPISDTIRSAMGRAAFFDDRECADFACADDACFVLDFTEGTALSNYVLPLSGTYEQGVGLHGAVSFHTPTGLWQTRVTPQFVQDGVTSLLINSIEWHFDMVQPSALGDTSFALWVAEPFTVAYTVSASPQPDSPHLEVIGYQSFLNYFAPTMRPRFVDTEQEAIDIGLILTKVVICAPAADVAYMESRFQMVGL